MFQNIGKWEPEYLLSDPAGAQPFAIHCTPGNGTLQRGQIMKRDENGMFSPAASADIVDTNYLAVLNETVDTNADATVAAAAAAYRAGKMIESKLVLKDGGSLTAANKLVLRRQGFLLDILMEDAQEFNNSTENE